MPNLEEIKAAAEIVHRVMLPTPQICWPLLSERAGVELWVKHENHSPTGAFKMRGGLVFVDRLKQRAPAVRGVIAATRGNHGQSIAFAAGRAGLRTVIVVPHGNSREKNAAMRALKAELIEQGNDFQDAFEYAQRLAREEDLHFVPSFDESLVAGVASYALELFASVAELDAVYVPIGLGSGICATIAVRDALGLKTEIIGVTAAAAPAYALSFAEKRPMTANVSTTIADGMACRVPDARALEIIFRAVARMVTVDEAGIKSAMRCLFTDTHNVAEGAGAAALAGLLKERDKMKGRRVAVILSGGNVDRETFGPILVER